MKGPLKYHGGKADLASWILSHAPPRVRNPNKPDPKDPGYLHYVEPYFGGGQVLFANDPEGISEVVNDINGDLVNFWNVLRCPTETKKLQRYVEATPFSQDLFESIGPDLGSPFPVDRAWRFFVRCRQSLAGRMSSFTGITKTRTRRGMNNEVSAWLSSIEGLPEVHARLKRVLILNDEAVSVIAKQDGPRTWFYLDPPYLQETRKSPNVYAHEMTEQQHRVLLETLTMIEGRFALSGYRSKLYDAYAKANKWRRVEKRINNHAAGGKTKRIMTECLYMNY